MAFVDPNVFRVDVDALKKDNEAELVRTMNEIIDLTKLKTDRDVIESPIPLIQSFPITHNTKTFAAGEGLTSIMRIVLPQNKIGFLSAIGTTFLQSSPNSYFQVLIDDRFIDGYSETDGRITRQIGDLLIPRPLIPPVVFRDRIEFLGSNEGNLLIAATLGFTIEGVIMDKPKFAGSGAIITADNVIKLIRTQRG